MGHSIGVGSCASTTALINNSVSIKFLVYFISRKPTIAPFDRFNIENLFNLLQVECHCIELVRPDELAVRPFWIAADTLALQVDVHELRRVSFKAVEFQRL